MNRFLLVFLTTAAAAVSDAGRPADPPAAKAPNAFMQLKLKNAQLVLNGIATGDYDLIETSADSLARLAKKAEFQLMTTPEYARHSDAFRRNAEGLAKAARDRNLDAAALGYVRLTLNCVNCHKHLREAQ